MVQRGLKPILQTMDNEASKALKQYLREADVEFQLAPPHIHRVNAAERAIRTFKNHFIAGLASTDKLFPLHLWDHLIPQAILTLNLLRPSRLNPRLSAWAQMEGAFDYNKTPVAPPGTKIVAHEKPNQRASWAAHGVDGWYTAPAMEHYRCYKVYITATHGERIVDTIQFFPTQTEMPKLSSADNAMRAAQELTEALQNPAPAAPFAMLGSEKLGALKDLARIFSDALPRVEGNKPDSADQHPQQHISDTLPRVGEKVTKPTNKYQEQDIPGRRRSPRISERITATSRSHAAVDKDAWYMRTRHTMPHIPMTPQNDEIPTMHAMAHMPMAHAVIDPTTGEALEYRHLIKHPTLATPWKTSAANEFGRLAQGIGNRIKGTDTIKFIPMDKVPKEKKVTYGRFVCDVRPQKAEPNRTRLTVGGNLLDYPGAVSTKTADITTCKCLFNSVVSTPGAKYMTVDIKNFYLNTPLDQYEYNNQATTITSHRHAILLGP